MTIVEACKLDLFDHGSTFCLSQWIYSRRVGAMTEPVRNEDIPKKCSTPWNDDRRVFENITWRSQNPGPDERACWPAILHNPKHKRQQTVPTVAATERHEYLAFDQPSPKSEECLTAHPRHFTFHTVFSPSNCSTDITADKIAISIAYSRQNSDIDCIRV